VPTTDGSRRIRFDPFEADVRSGELWNSGIKVKLGEQPFSVLALLLSQPGEVVTRDELQRTLWPADTFVDFDRGLNKAINRLRDALGDSAETPRFIETLPRRGYRFIGRVEPAVPPTEPPPESAPATIHDQHPFGMRGWLATMALIAVLVAAGSAWWLPLKRAAPNGEEPLIRSSILPPPGRTFLPHSLALSGDGTHLAFVAEAIDGARSLWIRAMSATSAVPIAGTEGAVLPFWSQDRRYVGFFADRKLKTVEIAGGVVRIIADAPRPSGGTWTNDDAIIFAPDVNGPLYRVAAAGGPATPATRVPDGEGIHGHRWPLFLPDSRQFLFVAFNTTASSDNGPELRIGSLGTLESTRLEWDGARSVGFALDHLIYARAGTLFAQTFDPASRRISGPPRPIAAVDVTAAPAFYPAALAVSANGVLLFQSAVDKPSQLIWLDDGGREQTPLPVKYGGPAISPDGRFLAGSCEGPRTGSLAICVLDLRRGISSRITEGPIDRGPVWSPDGRELAYSFGGGIQRVPMDGSRPPALVSRRGNPTSWLPDGRILSFGSQRGVVSLALSSPTTHEVTELGPGAEGQLSPDATWLAYLAPDGLAVQRFPDAMPRVVIAAAGAGQPRWSRNGRQLFYVSADKKLMAADFDPASGIAGSPRVLHQTRIVGAALVGFQYDVAPDGRFILNAASSEAAPLTLVSGWASLLHR